MNQPGQQIEVPTFQDSLAKDDANENGVVDKEELPEEPLSSWFGFVDLDGRIYVRTEKALYCFGKKAASG